MFHTGVFRLDRFQVGDIVEFDPGYPSTYRHPFYLSRKYPVKAVEEVPADVSREGVGHTQWITVDLPLYRDSKMSGAFFKPIR